VPLLHTPGFAVYSALSRHAPHKRIAVFITREKILALPKSELGEVSFREILTVHNLIGD